MKRILPLLLCLCAALPLGAQSHPNGLLMDSVDPVGDSIAIARVRARMDSIRKHRPTVAVVLAGGGAKGLAHLGVLRTLEELGIPVDLIGGTSMGGLVSGLYSMGYGEPYLDSLVRDIDWTVMMSDRIPDSYQSWQLRRNKERFFFRVPFHYAKDSDQHERNVKHRKVVNNMMNENAEVRTSDMGQDLMTKAGLGLPDGFLFGFNVRNLLSSVSVGYQDSLSFDQLPIPYYCVASEMGSMKEKNWTGGNVVTAMRSTMAIPFYFRPVRQEKMVLSDGGTRNNFPIAIARAMGADIVIGSEMPTKKDYKDLNNLSSLLLQNIAMMSADVNKQSREMADVLIEHELTGYNMLSFDKKSVEDILRQGYANACEARPQLEEIAARVGAKPDTSAAARPHAIDIAKRPVRIRSLRIDGVTDKEQDMLLSRILWGRSSYFNRADVEQILAILYGSRAFESVTYHFEGMQEPFELVFDCQKGQTSEFGAGVHVDNDEFVYVGAYVALGTRKLYGPRFLAELKAGNNMSILLDGSYKPRLKYAPVVGISFKNGYVRYNYRESDWSDTKYSAFNTRVDAYLDVVGMVNGSARLGLSNDFQPYENYLNWDMEWKGWDWKSRWHSVFGDFAYGNFDDSSFPMRGVKARLLGRYVFNGYSTWMEDRWMTEYEHYEGAVKPYGVVMGSISGAIPFGKHFSLNPSLYVAWSSRYNGQMASVHQVAAGGMLPGRYLEYQMPYIGYSTGFRVCENVAVTGSLDFTYRLKQKNFFTLQSGMFHTAPTWKDWVSDFVLVEYAFGLQYGRKTVVGPLKVGVHWNNLTGFGANVSFGFDF